MSLNVNYENAVAAAERALRSENERGRRQAQRFLVTRVCSVCHGTRLRPEALSSRSDGREHRRDRRAASSTSCGRSRRAAGGAAGRAAAADRRAARRADAARSTPLLDLGLGYLSLDREGASLSTGERQRIELTSTVRANTTGMLYVLDEPSVGLHPSNVEGLRTTIAALVANGNSVVIVEHDLELIRSADWVIELGPGAGRARRHDHRRGTPAQLQADPRSMIGPFLAGTATVRRERRAAPASPDGAITIEVSELYNLHDVTAALPGPPAVGAGRAVRGGQDRAGPRQPRPGRPRALSGRPLPGHVRRSSWPGSARSSRSTPRRSARTPARHPPPTPGRGTTSAAVFADTPAARRRRWKPGHFSFNTRAGQCPTCRGLGNIDLDVQYLPDINVPCPTCHGARFNDATLAVRVDGLTVADVLGLTVDEALAAVRRPGPGRPRPCARSPRSASATCGSGSRHRRCRAASRSGCGSPRGCAAASATRCTSSTSRPPDCIRSTSAPWSACSTGCSEAGATIIVIDHDLDLLAAADHVIDMGPGGGPTAGGSWRPGTPEEVARDPDSVTGPWLAEHLGL